MAEVTKSGPLKKLAASSSAFLVTVEVENDSPPPPTVDKTYEVNDSKMQTLVSGAKIGDTISVTVDTAAPTVATAVSRP